MQDRKVPHWLKAHRAIFWRITVGLIILGLVSLVIGLMRSQTYTTVRVGDGVFRARLAQTESERSRGLGGVEYLPKHEVMLFVYEESQPASIWMKDMVIPIDVVWLDDGRKVIHIETNLQPDSYPATYGPDRPARYFIEFTAGTVNDKTIRVGSQAFFDESIGRGGE